jgi:hypothetical protein
MCDRILALDPSQRGLGSRERLRRSREILTAVQACVGSPLSLSDSEEANVTLAEQLWPQCAMQDEALSRVMSKLAGR